MGGTTLRGRCTSLEKREDDSGLGVDSDGGDDHLSRAFHYVGAGQQHRTALFDAFLDVIRFARERRLVDLEIVGLEQNAVGRDRVSVLHLTNVSHHQFRRWNLDRQLISNH